MDHERIVPAAAFGFGLAHLGALAIMVAACQAPPPPKAAPARPAATCLDACSVLTALECPEADTTPRGDTCEALCERVATSGELRLPVACVAGQTDVEGVRQCGVRCSR